MVILSCSLEDLDCWVYGPDSPLVGSLPQGCGRVSPWFWGGEELDPGSGLLSTGGSNTGGLCTPLGDS